jgi:hypothetical protein
MSADRGYDDPAAGNGGSRTSRRRFLGTAAGAAAVSAVVVAGAEAAGTRPAQAQSTSEPGYYDVTDYGAVGDGSTDDTAAIQAAVNAAQTAGQGVVYFPVGVFCTSSPIVITQPNIFVQGECTPFSLSSGGLASDPLSVIRPVIVNGSVNWSQGTASQPAFLLWDAVTPGAAFARGGVQNLEIDGAGQTLTASGVGTYGHVTGFTVDNVAVCDMYGTTQIGIQNFAGTVTGNKTPDGNRYTNVVVNACYGGGLFLAGADLDVSFCHAQGSQNGDAFYIFAGGGNVRLNQCRGDLSYNGYHIDVEPSTPGSASVQLTGCTTQANQQNGLKVDNSATEGDFCPVYVANCTFQGDGTNGGDNAGIRLSGKVLVTVAGGGVLVGTQGSPPWAVACDVAQPLGLQMLGGFYNAINGFDYLSKTPAVSDIRVFGYFGSAWTENDTPALVTSL